MFWRNGGLDTGGRASPSFLTHARLTMGYWQEAGTKLSYVFQSQGCDSFFLQPVAQKLNKNGKSEKFMAGHGPCVPTRCEETGSKFLMGGPIWCAPVLQRGNLRSSMCFEGGPGTHGMYEKGCGMA